MPAQRFVAALAPLFEGAPRFLGRLAALRPFRTDAALLGAARQLAAALPEEEQVELLNAHPRIGAAPNQLPRLSHAEQGYAAPVPAPGMGRVDAELARLNASYEARFGFRFVIFVAGRDRASIGPLLAEALDAERDAELRRGLEDCVAIAAARLERLRASSGEGRRAAT